MAIPPSDSRAQNSAIVWNVFVHVKRSGVSDAGLLVSVPTEGRDGASPAAFSVKMNASFERTTDERWDATRLMRNTTRAWLQISKVISGCRNTRSNNYKGKITF